MKKIDRHELLSRDCVPCNAETTPLTQEQIDELLPCVTDWTVATVDGVPRLQRVFRFPDFKEAMLFAAQIGELADEQGHHPRLTVEWRQTTVEWWTHNINGLHQNDFIMAVRVDDLYSRWALISGQRDEVEQASDESFPASDPPGY